MFDTMKQFKENGEETKDKKKALRRCGQRKLRNSAQNFFRKK